MFSMLALYAFLAVLVFSMSTFAAFLKKIITSNTLIAKHSYFL